MMTFNYGLGMFVYNISALIVIALITYKVLYYVTKKKRKKEHLERLLKRKPWKEDNKKSY